MTDDRELSKEEVVREPEDCIACRLVGGGGCLGAFTYVAYHASRNTNRTGRYLAFVFAGALAGIGITRLLRLPPFEKGKHMNSFTS